MVADRLLDFLAEGRYGLVFLGLRRKAVFEPMGKNGPDLLVTKADGELIVEVKRFRKVNTGHLLLLRMGPGNSLNTAILCATQERAFRQSWTSLNRLIPRRKQS